MAIHNTTGHAVPLIWLLLNSQSTVELVANTEIMLNIRKVRGKDTIRGNCNSRVNIVDRVGDLPGYGNFWYKPTGIASILLMSRETKKFWVVFYSKGGDFFMMFLPYRDVSFQIIPNGLDYFDAADRENIVLLLNTV